MVREKLGGSFGLLWTAFVASTAGTWLGFGAFALIAIQVLHAGPAAVSALAAAATAAGALVALPLGPWVEARPKRRVMIGADLVRCAALLSVPIGYACGLLSYAQLVVVAVIGAVANIAFTAASGAFLRSVVREEQLLTASGRLESAGWIAVAAGPPLGGAAVKLFGPLVTVAANAAGFLVSALSVGAIRDRSPQLPDRPAPASATLADRSVPDRAALPDRSVRAWAGELVAGWRFVHADPVLRPLLRNTVAVNALIMATEPLLAVLLLADFGWPAWQYGLAFGLPCLGGFAGARLAGVLVARCGSRRVLRGAAVVRVLWPVGLFFVTPGPAGVLFVIVVELALITCIGVFNPVLATERLRRIPPERTARVLVAWSVTSTAAIAVATALWGVLAAYTGARVAIGIAGVLLLATPLLLLHRSPGQVGPLPHQVRPRAAGRPQVQGRDKTQPEYDDQDRGFRPFPGERDDQGPGAEHQPGPGAEPPGDHPVPGEQRRPAGQRPAGEPGPPQTDRDQHGEGHRGPDRQCRFGGPEQTDQSAAGEPGQPDGQIPDPRPQ
ncbi:MFS transporter [Actinoplanes palleronii]|uniref:MFS transporter n=1 Tax=Actinoplanes palleronii TaxID=113570 RepID=A0ABQ4BRW1_9ACTN|nr:MFS transporter [Actinoplanes palleronii]GIE73380.1 MFS transporter [Actinoplanes palleronii]